MGISKSLLRTVDKVGASQRQNLEWLIEFAQSDADTPTMRDECVYFMNSVSRTNRGRLAEVSLQSLRSSCIPSVRDVR